MSFRNKSFVIKVCVALFVVVCAYFTHGSFGSSAFVAGYDHADARVVLSKQLPLHDTVLKSSQKPGDVQGTTSVRVHIESGVSKPLESKTLLKSSYWLFLLFDGTIFSRDYA